MSTITWSEFKSLVDTKIKEYLNSPDSISYDAGEPPQIKIKFIETVSFPSKEDLQIEIYDHTPGLIYIVIL